MKWVTLFVGVMATFALVAAGDDDDKPHPSAIPSSKHHPGGEGSHPGTFGPPPGGHHKNPKPYSPPPKQEYGHQYYPPNKHGSPPPEKESHPPRPRPHEKPYIDDEYKSPPPPEKYGDDEHKSPPPPTLPQKEHSDGKEYNSNRHHSNPKKPTSDYHPFWWARVHRQHRQGHYPVGNLR
jgi:hypothetical protein